MHIQHLQMVTSCAWHVYIVAGRGRLADGPAIEYTMGDRIRLNQPEIVDLYKTVIADVCEDIKEAFLDENIDRDVLGQLKKDWEDKVNASGAVDLTPKPVVPTPMRGAPMGRLGGMPMGRMQQPNQPVNLGPRPIHVIEGQGSRPVQMQYVQQGIPHLQSSQVVSFPQGAVRMVQTIQPNQFVQQPMMFIQNQGQGVPVSMAPNTIIQQRIGIPQQLQHQQQQGGMHQLDGGGCAIDALEDQTPVSSSSTEEPSASNDTNKPQTKKPSRKEAERVLHSLFGNMLQLEQIDGGGGGMSDSSSEDEEEENDPLRRIADRIGGDGQIDEEEGVVEEDPLNSEDDQSDDEEGEQAFDAVNIIMCQFEKIHRARNKWKFQLKDGIMHLVADNRDYCFHKCTGEAEW